MQDLDRGHVFKGHPHGVARVAFGVEQHQLGQQLRAERVAKGPNLVERAAVQTKVSVCF